MRISITATLICVATQPIWAVDIPIVNAGFEQVVLSCAPAFNCFLDSTVTGWAGTGWFGTWKPPIGSQGFLSSVPEGVNVAYLGRAGTNGTLLQTLGASLEPNTAYTLVYSVGTQGSMPSAGYSVELLAGTSTLATDSSLAPASGTFATGRILYSSTNANPALLGQRLGIRLTGNANGQPVFDKISLDAMPTVIFGSANQIASGGGWKTTLTLLNLSSTQNSVRVVFRGDDGSPLTLPLMVTQQGVSQAVTAVERTVEPGATLLIESEAPASSATVVGWAEVVSAGPVSGFAIFRQRGLDGRDSEGTAPLESSKTSSLILPFDNTTGFATGVALVNPTAQATIISATIRDDNGAQIGLEAVSLPAMGHVSFAVADRFSVTSNRRGIIVFESTGGGAVAGLGLRFSPFGTFTSVPVTVQ